MIEEDYSFEQIEALIVFFSLQRYPEHLGLLCGSKAEAHGALPRAALGASFSMLKPEIAISELCAAGRRERPF